MQYIVPKLPLLEYALSLFPNVSLAGTLIIGVQHLLPTEHSLFHALFKMGLKPDNLLVIGKCYSTNPTVFTQLQKEGILVSELSSSFDSHRFFDHQFDDIVRKFLKDILDTYDLGAYEKVIFLDDGGHLLEEVYRLGLNVPNAWGIEQTSSGYNKTKHLSFNFPIINLARSWVKLRYETPFIMQEALNSLDRALKKREIENCSALILGNGVLGNLVHKYLKSKLRIDVYDINPKQSLIPTESFVQTLEKSNLIIGCTGAVSLSREFHSRLTPSTILASMSSSDREFDSAYLRKKAPLESDCHRHMNIDRIELLNCGFPINFSDNYASADSEDLQITRSLILASIAQIYLARQWHSGFHDLDDAVQQSIAQKFLHLRNSYGARGSSLS